MQRLFAVVITLMMILFFINGGKSLNCFVCRSDDDDGCSDEVNQKFSVACPDRPNATGKYCRKIKQKLRFKDQSDYTSIRECAYEKGPRACYFYKWIELAQQETCECEHDLCNRGSLVIPNFKIMFVTFLLWVINYLINR